MTTRISSIMQSCSEERDRIASEEIGDDDAQDKFEKRVIHNFMRNTKTVLTAVVLRELKKVYPRQEDRAKIVGLERTSWSRIEKKQRMRLEYLELILARFPRISLPPASEIAHAAAVRTISYILTKEVKDRRDIPPLTREEYEFLFEMLLDNEWTRAHDSGDVSTMCQLYPKLAQRVHSLPAVETRRVLTYGQLEHILDIWRESFLLGIYTIPFAS